MALAPFVACSSYLIGEKVKVKSFGASKKKIFFFLVASNNWNWCLYIYAIVVCGRYALSCITIVPYNLPLMSHWFWLAYSMQRFHCIYFETFKDILRGNAPLYWIRLQTFNTIRTYELTQNKMTPFNLLNE